MNTRARESLAGRSRGRGVDQLIMIAGMTPIAVTPLAAPCSRVAAGWPGAAAAAASPAAATPAATPAVATSGVDRLRPLAGSFDKQARPPRGIPR
jgi:hypothetical protein